MCDCLKESTAQVLEHLKKDYAGRMEVGARAECMNSVIQVSGGKMTLRTTTNFEVECIPLKKDGTKGKPRKVKMPVLHAFCPSCGQPFDEPKLNLPDDLTSGQ